MLQKLGKKHRLLPAVPLWPGELAHWRTHGLPSPELLVLLLGNIKGLGTALLRHACQPPSLSFSLLLSPDGGGKGGGGVGGSGSILIDALSHCLLAPADMHATFFFLC